jgi:hypothetical protein
MKARDYRLKMIYSPLDFHANKGLAESRISYQSEPFLIGSKLRLTITKRYLVGEMDSDKPHEVLSVESVYEIPVNEIKSREFVYEFYKDAILGLNEVYKAYESEISGLPNRLFLTPAIENYKGEIDRVFNLLNSQN